MSAPRLLYLCIAVVVASVVTASMLLKAPHRARDAPLIGLALGVVWPVTVMLAGVYGVVFLVDRRN